MSKYSWTKVLNPEGVADVLTIEKEVREKQELSDLVNSYNSLMANERYTSDRRGYEQR